MSITKKSSPYGSWISSLSANILAQKGKRFGHMAFDEGFLYWIEVRANEKGRGVLLRSSGLAKCEEVLPSDISVRTKVHEYGGGDYLVKAGVIYFSSGEDGRVYAFQNGKLTALTPLEANKEYRYADFTLDAENKKLICVRETHYASDPHHVINELVAIDILKHSVQVLHSGFDFYSFPRISPKGNRICWTCWNQPAMPWDGAELWLADLHANGSIDAAHKVNGGNGDAIFQPAWSGEGVLHYVSDQSGWQNLYSHEDGVLNALAPIDRDFGVPQWIFGLGTYVIQSDGSIYSLYFENGQQHLAHICPENGHTETLEVPFKNFQGQMLSDDKSLFFCAASPDTDYAMYKFDLKTRDFLPLSELSSFPLPSEDISVAQPISFKSENSRKCYAFYYSPKNSHYEAPQDTKPPLIVMSHGGPTGFTENSLNASIQFWTNRGFAVVDVNYGGSTGFGRKYRESLSGQWGIVDVEDCVAAAKYLVDKGLADKNALLIRGGSAGGYTTLCALTFTDVFKAGMSRYGVADLESLASDSHKFEARYLDKMVGPYPECKDIYVERSPIHSTNKLSCPILLLQGSEDKVVPPNQAELMVAALEKKKIPYAYKLYEGEGHGFRNASTIVSAFNAELAFYRKVLGINSEEEIGELLVHYLD